MAALEVGRVVGKTQRILVFRRFRSQSLYTALHLTHNRSELRTEDPNLTTSQKTTTLY